MNDITVADVYPLPRIDEIIDKAVGSRSFSKTDLHAGFHQVRVYKAHVERTAFKTKYGIYQFKVMPFVLQDLRGMVGAYVDDIFTGTNALEDMAFALRELYVRLAEQKLYPNPGSVVLGSRRWKTVGLSLGEMVLDHSHAC